MPNRFRSQQQKHRNSMRLARSQFHSASDVELDSIASDTDSVASMQMEVVVMPNDDDASMASIVSHHADDASGSSMVAYDLTKIDSARQFDMSISNFTLQNCTQCPRSSPTLKLVNNVCEVCRRANGEAKFSHQNKMDPGMVPPELTGLTYIEQMLIALIHPVVSVFRLNGAQYAYKGNVINFWQDIQHYARILPHIPTSLPSTILFARTTSEGVVHFRARRAKIATALRWLKANHIYYRDIVISQTNLETIPVDDFIHNQLQVIMNNDFEAQASLSGDVSGENIDQIVESFVPRFDPVDHDMEVRRMLEIPYPSTSSNPIDEFNTEGYIVCAFPCLFPFGLADLNQSRPTKVTPDEYFKFLFEYRDRRFAKDPRFRFFAMNSLLRRQILGKMNLYYNRSRTAPLNVREIKQKIESEPNFLREVMVYCAQIRSTNAYWVQRCHELLTMVEQLGLPTVFFTLSAADYHWPDLFRLLAPSKNPATLTETERRELMHENPDLVAYFFQKRVKLFIDIVLTPVFSVRDYWFRFEWQWRGSPHIHGLLWLNNSPTLSQKTISVEKFEEVKQYFDSFCFATNPMCNDDVPSVHPCRKTFSEIVESNLLTDLSELVNVFQRHTECGTHCLRAKRKGGPLKCRFKFPKELRTCSALFFDDNQHLQYEPIRNDPLICRFNAFVTQVWRANTDFSPVTDIHAVLSYIAKYASKGEKSSKSYIDMLKEVVRDELDETNGKKMFSRLLIRSLGERDYSAQEVIHILKGWPLFSSTRTFLTLVVSDNQWERVSSDEQREGASLLKKYLKRPNQEPFSNMSLIQFATKCNCERKVYRSRTKDAIVRILPRLSLTGEDENDVLYYRQKVILNSVYIGENFDVNNLLFDSISGIRYETWKERFDAMDIESYDVIPFPEPDDDGEIVERVNDCNQLEPYMAAAAMQPVPVEQNLGIRTVDLAYNWQDISRNYPDEKEVRQFLKDFRQSRRVVTVVENNVETITFSDEQQRLIDLCSEQIESIQGIVARQPPKRIIVQGKAGCGKSTVIKEIVKKVTEQLGEDCVRVLAPTGMAALNIDGSTIHSLFKLPIRTNKFDMLHGQSERQLQQDFINVKFLIIDEMSLIGCRLLTRIDKRCRQAKANPEQPFGGLVVYMFGDYRQLTPVLDKAVYSTKIVQQEQIEGKIAFDTFELFVELQQCHRQGGPESIHFRALLDNLSIGTLTQFDFELLETRRSAMVLCACRNEQITCPRCEETRSFSNAVRLFATNNEVNEANNHYLRSTGNPVARIAAVHRPDIASKATDEQANGLANVINLSVGCRVMLRKNLWVAGGLVNGSLGTVQAIVYGPNENPPTLPKYILVEFDNYGGPYFPTNSNCFPIVPIVSTWKERDSVTMSRTQFPLSVAHAITIHKSQGLTLSKAIVNVGTTESNCGQTYVALSRVKRLNDLVIQGFYSKQRFDSIGKAQEMKDKIAFLQRHWGN